MGSAFEQSVTFSEPFHGPVWLGVSRAGSPPQVRLVVSIEERWDADIFIAPRDAGALADALGDHEPQVVKAKTADGDLAVVVAERDRLAITVLSERLSDVLILGEHAEAIRQLLMTAGAPDSS